MSLRGHVFLHLYIFCSSDQLYFSFSLWFVDNTHQILAAMSCRLDLISEHILWDMCTHQRPHMEYSASPPASCTHWSRMLISTRLVV